MTIYLDSDYICHLITDSTMVAVETNTFEDNAYNAHTGGSGIVIIRNARS